MKTTSRDNTQKKKIAHNIFRSVGIPTLFAKKLIDIAKAIAPNTTHDIIGVRPGEKLHEQMIGLEDSPYTYEYNDYFKILPAIHEWCNDLNRIKDGKLVTQDFTYSSDNNEEWMGVDELREWIEANNQKIGKY